MAFPYSLPLIPQPSSVLPGDGAVALAAPRIIGAGPTAPLLRDALAARTGSAPAELLPTADPQPGDVVLRVDPALGAEAYALTVADRIEIVGGDEAGLFYGTRTLLQLVQKEDGAWVAPRVRIADAPRFGYRGVMLDVARHFFDVDDVKTYIDRAADLKFNALHLHLTDDQGWRIQIDSWPLLAERGGANDAEGGPGGFYTKDDYRAIVAHAADRHMIVVPEIDLPGHTHAVGVAYPDLVEEPVISEGIVEQSRLLGQPLPEHGRPFPGWAVGHSSVRIHDERTYGFVRDVLGELAEITPGPYLHIGGDECLGTPAEDFAHFFERVSRIAADTGKTPIAWHEAGAVAGIAEGTIGQYWGNTEPRGTHAEEAAHFVERGGALIMSASNVAYLDMKYDESFPLGLTWAGLIDVRTAYDWEPTAVVPGLAADAVLGVEAPLWTETVGTLAEADRLVYPRIAAHAETAWSASDVRDWESFRVRVAGLAPAWKTAGIAFHPAEEIPWP